MIVPSVIGLLNYGGMIGRWGFIPSDPMRHHGLTFLTSFFIHGNGRVLAFNCVAMILYGAGFERTMGRLRLLVTLLGGQAVSCLMRLLLTGDSIYPSIGAGPAILAVVVPFVRFLPKVEATITPGPYDSRPFIGRYGNGPLAGYGCSARFIGIAWLLWTIFLSLARTRVPTGMSVLGVFGGLLAGVAFSFVWKSRFRDAIDNPEIEIPAEDESPVA